MAYAKPGLAVLASSLEVTQGTPKAYWFIDWLGWSPSVLVISVCAYEADE